MDAESLVNAGFDCNTACSLLCPFRCRETLQVWKSHSYTLQKQVFHLNAHR